MGPVVVDDHARDLQAGGETAQDISYQEVTTEPVKWDKWGRGPGRFWEEIPFVYFEHELDRDDIAELMGEENPQFKRLEAEGFGDGEDKDKAKGEAAKGVYKTMTVFEVWDKRSKQVVFVAKRVKDFPLKVIPDPLGLQGFYPVPSPLQPIERLGDLRPVTPYQVYQHLITELDEVTKRIRKLVNQLKVRGIIAGEMADDALAALVAGQLKRRGIEADARLPSICALFKDRCDTTVALADWAQRFHADVAASPEEREKHLTPQAMAAVRLLARRLEACAWDAPSIASAIKETLAESGLKMPQLAMPVRVLVMGTAQTPSLDAVLALCDRATVLARLSSG